MGTHSPIVLPTPRKINPQSLSIGRVGTAHSRGLGTEQGVAMSCYRSTSGGRAPCEWVSLTFLFPSSRQDPTPTRAQEARPSLWMSSLRDWGQEVKMSRRAIQKAHRENSGCALLVPCSRTKTRPLGRGSIRSQETASSSSKGTH